MTTFKRYEVKYLLTVAQAKALQRLMETYMSPDAFGDSVIHNIYYDTPDYKLIRRSIEKPVYKEKLRLRSYGLASDQSAVYVELKKKYEGVVYKRRIALAPNVASAYLNNGQTLDSESQISHEIDYFKKIYQNLAPRVYVSYHRKAYYGKDDLDFRMTFDTDVLYRTSNLDLSHGEYGKYVLPKNNVILEVKLAYGMPTWLRNFLTEHKIYKTSYSKYGRAYLDMLENQQSEKTYAA